MAKLKTQKEPQAPKDPPDINVPDRFTREDAKRAALFLQNLLRANGSLSKPVLLSSRNKSGEPTATELPQSAVQLLAKLLTDPTGVPGFSCRGTGDEGGIVTGTQTQERGVSRGGPWFP